TITIGGGSLAGTGGSSYGGSGDCIGYALGACGGGSPSYSSGDMIGSCIACVGAGDVIVDPEWARMIELEKEKKFWLGDDEVKRLGLEVMPNGRPVDQPNFWFADEKVQNTYMENWTPELKDKQLEFIWIKAGGLDSFVDMINAAEANPNDPRLAGFKVPVLGAPNKSRIMSQSAASNKRNVQLKIDVKGFKTPSGKGRDKYFHDYWMLVAYAPDIQAAATKWKVDRHTLTAVLIFELTDLEVRLHRAGVGDRVNVEINGKDGSYGLAQLEPWKAQRVIKKYQGKTINTDTAIATLLNPTESIHLAAMWLKYVKETVKIPLGSRDNARRDITWAEAGVAYCGCSGVTLDKENNNEFTWREFIKWRKGLKVNGAADARLKALESGGWASNAANAYWNCVNNDTCSAVAKRGWPF
ncbi:hypothetical protein HCN51_19555, partial [Nonomuraea sp. FMUSA5-5]